MPMPVTSQPMRMAPGDALFDMSDGRLKTPPPIIDPTTSAIRGRSVNFGVDSAGISLAASTVVITTPAHPPGLFARHRCRLRLSGDARSSDAALSPLAGSIGNQAGQARNHLS